MVGVKTENPMLTPFLVSKDSISDPSLLQVVLLRVSLLAKTGKDEPQSIRMRKMDRQETLEINAKLLSNLERVGKGEPHPCQTVAEV